MAQFRLGEAALQIVCPACHENVVGGMFLMRRHGAAEPEDLQAGRHMPIVMQPMGCMPLIRARQDPQELPTCSGGVQKNVAENTDTVVADGDGGRGNSSGGVHVAIVAARSQLVSESARGGGFVAHHCQAMVVSSQHQVMPPLRLTQHGSPRASSCRHR